MIYTYDFGDSWDHIIAVESVAPTPDGVAYPRCHWTTLPSSIPPHSTWPKPAGCCVFDDEHGKTGGAEAPAHSIESARRAVAAEAWRSVMPLTPVTPGRTVSNWSTLPSDVTHAGPYVG